MRAYEVVATLPNGKRIALGGLFTTAAEVNACATEERLEHLAKFGATVAVVIHDDKEG